MITIKIGGKGEIVIPKKIRTALGLEPRSTAVLTVKDNKLEVAAKREDIVERWAQRAQESGRDLSQVDWDAVYDEMYEEKFKDILQAQ